jgi:hypothetical protein
MRWRRLTAARMFANARRGNTWSSDDMAEP